jgi:hypothetical protein
MRSRARPQQRLSRRRRRQATSAECRPSGDSLLWLLSRRAPPQVPVARRQRADIHAPQRVVRQPGVQQPAGVQRRQQHALQHQAPCLRGIPAAVDCAGGRTGWARRCRLPALCRMQLLHRVRRLEHRCELVTGKAGSQRAADERAGHGRRGTGPDAGAGRQQLGDARRRQRAAAHHQQRAHLPLSGRPEHRSGRVRALFGQG